MTVHSSSDNEVTAIEMAIDARVDPKVFRAALRKERFPWHVHGAQWTVARYSPEHGQMAAVLFRLNSN